MDTNSINEDHLERPAPQLASAHPMKWILISAVLLVIIVAALLFGTPFLLPSSGGAVAIVNGEKISRDTFNERVEEAGLVLSGQGAMVEGNEALLSQMKDQVLQDLISETLLLQAAEKKNIIVTDAEVDAAIKDNEDLIASESTSTTLADLLAQFGLSEEEYRHNVQTSLIIDKFITMGNEAALAVDPADVESYYAEYASSTPNPLPFDDIKDSIESLIVDQKKSNLLQAQVEQLRASSTIEILYKPEKATTTALDSVSVGTTSSQ